MSYPFIDRLPKDIGEKAPQTMSQVIQSVYRGVPQNEKF